MKKLGLYFLILLFLAIGIYLQRSYAHFYSFLGQNHLASPLPETTVIVGNKPGSQTIEYIALGDSLTEGVGVSDYKNSFPYLVAQKLSSKSNVKLVNLARGGDTSSDVLAGQLPKALSQKPDLITILIGINDLHNLKSTKEFKGNLIQTVTALKKGGARVYLLSLPYLGSDEIVHFPYNLILDFRTRQFNDVVKSVATDYGIGYIDLYFLSKSANFYSPDQFHPGEAGYQAWSKAINVN